MQQEYICPECGFVDEAKGRCPSCDVNLIPMDKVGEEHMGETEEPLESGFSAQDEE